MLNKQVLIVDNDEISKEHLNSTLDKTKWSFENNHIALLTFEHRKKYIEEKFKCIEMIYPPEKFCIKRYKIAFQLLKERKRNLDFIILTSLDITPMIVALFFTRANVCLFNRWNQWWSIRQRTTVDLIKIPIAIAWFAVIVARNITVFIYLLFSAFFFWLKRFFLFKRA